MKTSTTAAILITSVAILGGAFERLQPDGTLLRKR
jgi:hypothetical protein